MGYSISVPSGFLRVNSKYNNQISLTNVAVDYAMNAVNFPVYQGDLKLATLDLSVAQIQDVSGGDNYLAADQYIQVRKSSVGGAWTDSLQLKLGLFFARANTLETGSISYYGSTDISGICASGDALDVQWHNGKAQSNTLAMRGAAVSVNMYFI